ncbi:MAG: peptidoglycan-binding protein [Catenulispora sp.]
MIRTRIFAAAVILATSLGTATVTATQAQARVGADWVGPGEPNNPHAVWCVQRILNVLDHAGLAEDGSFGPATQGAVNKFQWAHQLSGDGIVGPKTGRMLLNSFASYQHTTVWNPYCSYWLPT